MENGGPALEGITNKIYEFNITIKQYLIAAYLPDVDITRTGVTNFTGPEGTFDVEVFDSASDYIKLMKSIFDFESIRKLLSSPLFTFCYDGVARAYSKSIFVDELGAQESFLLNCTLKEDFGGGHPDPNLTYAKEFVASMGLGKSEPQEFGAAGDGDADRNMILGFLSLLQIPWPLLLQMLLMLYHTSDSSFSYVLSSCLSISSVMCVCTDRSTCADVHTFINSRSG